MKLVISPAISLDFETELPTSKHTEPQFLDQSECLNKLLKKKSVKTLGFTHPKTGRFMRFETPIPEDMVACIEKWRNYSRHQEL